MLVFNVRCEVLEPIQLTDVHQNRITLAPGVYRLQGVEQVVRKAAGQTAAEEGTHITFVTDSGGQAAYTVSAEELAHFMATDEVEVHI